MVRPRSATRNCSCGQLDGHRKPDTSFFCCEILVAVEYAVGAKFLHLFQNAQHLVAVPIRAFPRDINGWKMAILAKRFVETDLAQSQFRRRTCCPYVSWTSFTEEKAVHNLEPLLSSIFPKWIYFEFHFFFNFFGWSFSSIQRYFLK